MPPLYVLTEKNNHEVWIPDSTHAVSGQIDGVYYELGECRDYMDRDDDSISSDS